MNRHVITDGAQRYTRISKAQARRIFESGKDSFYIIAHKMRPGMPFSMGMTIDCARYATENAERAKYGSELIGFDSMTANFCYYNANCHETGTYAAFYLVADRDVSIPDHPRSVRTFGA
jgi:hypothetical protein